MGTILKVLIAIALLAATAVVVHDAVAIFQAYEQKSLFSYLLKSGGSDAGSTEALQHIAGVREYGQFVALRLTVASIFLGFLLGAVAASCYFRRANQCA